MYNPKMLRFLLLALLAVPFVQAQTFDLLIRNGHVIDGTGSPWYAADIGVTRGHIAAIGRLPNATATTVIDAHNRVVAPGFIDMLGQSETTILVEPRLPSKIFQGITTEITGEGNTVAPVNDRMRADGRPGFAHYGLTQDWSTFREYFARLERQGMGINLGSYAGATQVREFVIGDEDRAPTSAELEQMRGLVRHAMQDGALGLSTALQYAPAPYAKTEELIALAQEARQFGGIYSTHMRNEGDHILDALDETFRIGREAQIPVEIWHLKAAGVHNFGRMPQIVERINAARHSGVDVAADTYAYTAWFNTFSAFIPPWAHVGGDTKLIERLKDPATRARIHQDLEDKNANWDNEWQEIEGPESILIGVVQNPELLPMQGKRLTEVAKLWNETPFDALCDLLIRDHAATEVAVFGMSEPDVALALQQPWVSIDNDSQGTSPEGILAGEHPHPRAYGTFPRILRKYVREEGKLTLPDAIRKFSALPASRLRLNDRGVVKAGMWADLVIFDPDRVTDLATFDKPNQLSQGMDCVLVNGVPVILEGQMTGKLPGHVIRGPGFVMRGVGASPARLRTGGI
jgi:N-acyl-D-amino-acid deacylase